MHADYMQGKGLHEMLELTELIIAINSSQLPCRYVVTFMG